WWRGGSQGLRRFPHVRSRANPRTRDAAGPCRGRMRGRARLARPGAAPPRGPPAPGRGPRSRPRGTHRVAPPGPRGSRPPLRTGPDRARVRVARAPTPRETRAPQRGGEDRRSARCGREVPAAPRDPWFGDDQGGAMRGWITYRDVAKGTRLLPGCEMRDAGWERHRTHLASRIPCSYVLFLSLMLPFTVFASTSPERSAAATSPFTVFPRNRTPAGTRTVKSTVTSLSRTFMWPPSPASQVFS